MHGRAPKAMCSFGEAQLQIVGLPYVKADTSSSNACPRRCPACGAFFRWELSSELLDNGSEDQIVLTSLAPENRQQREEALLAHIRAEEEAPCSRAASLAEAIRADAPPEVASRCGWLRLKPGPREKP
ncbi:MAG: hypothetical protein KA072_06350 [Thermoanaerobaculaceae bacterium]|nr:hypothetical protein [Thermoanaerobaculaceae bacterium]MDI9621990.1 hypothetical protein [Acidobacteriota bacterium]HPW54779.1 hypothetical protein [Thermoanaerobaculaceae bacterium]